MGMIERIASWAGYERRFDDRADPSWGAIAPGIGYQAGASARCAENLSTVLACTNAIATALAYVPALREAFRERHQGAANAGSTLVLDAGLTWKAAQISPEDAELLESRKFGVEEICRLFQVPPPIVQDYSHNTFTNSETAGRWFATFCLAPWARKIEAEFARSVFPTNGPFELSLDLSGFLRGDPETRWAAHKIALDSGVLDPDEVRQEEGWNKRGNRPAQGVNNTPAPVGGQADD